MLASHHRLMFEEMRTVDETKVPNDSCCSASSCCGPALIPLADLQGSPDFARLEAVQQAKLEEQLADGSCVAWIGEYQNKPVASGAVSFVKTTPVPEDLSYTVGFLHSVYTDEPMRSRGIASSIVDRLLDHCRQNGLKRVLLNASEAGRSIYRSKGFKTQDEAMILWL